jgi:hypothetical protein
MASKTLSAMTHRFLEARASRGGGAGSEPMVAPGIVTIGPRTGNGVSIQDQRRYQEAWFGPLIS